MKLALAFLVLAVVMAASPANAIYGGISARKGEFPFIVDFLGSPCGGVIVNAHYVLTSYSCVATSLSIYGATGGEHNKDVEEGTEQRRNFTRSDFIRHPGYNSTTQQNDIALIPIRPRFEFNEWVQPAKLATPGFEPATSLVSAGWGWTYWLSDFSAVLRRVTQSLAVDEECATSHNWEGFYPGHLCAGGDALRGICNGDEGGPLVSGDTVVAIAIRARGCFLPGSTGLYTKIADYYAWIQGIVN